MLHSILAPRTWITTCALVWVAAACSSGPGNGQDFGSGGPADAGSGRGDGAAGSDSSSGSGSSSSSGSNSSSGSSSGDVDAASDSGNGDAGPPPPPSCMAGDRSEWSGTIPNTVISVAVCSGCGVSYVVASNGSASTAQVTVDNGTMTIMTDVPANGTATSATLADKAADGTVTVCGTSGSKGCLPNATPNQRYCNPYRDMMNLSPERIDQGVDYGGGGPIYAIGPGTVDVYKNRNDAGWPGGTFVSYDVSAGPAMGKTIYLAENIDLNPALQQGSYVFSGTVLGTQVDASPQSESGWGVMGESITQEYSCYTEGCDTPLGDNYNSLLVCLNAPSGVSGTGGCCPAANGWPTNWCMLLSNWQ
jgi:hypothetical protein